VTDIVDVADLTVASAPHFGVFPALMTNPSQDYLHMKDRRNHIQALNYNGLRAPSSRSTGGGHICAIFSDQSANVASITPADIELRLIQPPGSGGPFTIHATQELDFEACEVLGLAAGTIPASTHSSWRKVDFNH
jgi:hypothetical protein